MKRCFFFSLIAFSLGLNAQNIQRDSVFNFGANGLTDYVVVDIPNKTSAEAYKKTLDWISVTYKNPKDVVLSQIENQYIRIEGFNECLFQYKNLFATSCIRAKYQIEIFFKDNRYKFAVIKITAYAPAAGYATGGWIDFPIKGPNNFYDIDGKPRKKNFESIGKSITDYFNMLNSSLHYFLNSNNIPSKGDDW
jgi:hypothetical protein